jgi:hypothetical protein
MNLLDADLQKKMLPHLYTEFPIALQIIINVQLDDINDSKI